jgi:serine/threonine-protein kinase
MIGQRLGNWIIDRELGSGGMGRVYLAHHDPHASAPAPAERAAVKVLTAVLAQDPGFELRFRREVEILRQLDHPNVVRYYESGTQDGHSFFAMEYVEGNDFEDLLQEHGSLPWQEVLSAALQVSLALKHAHDRGVIHRDLKPSNLLRASDGTVKLTDFGIAKVFAGTHLTATGGVVGTAEYLSPEQAVGKPVTKRSDLYSLGVVLYTLLTGRTPFVGDSVPELLHKHRFAQFDLPSRLVPDLPHDVEKVVCDLLEKDPAQRPADGQVLHRQLERIRGKLERKARDTEAPYQPTKTQVAAADTGRGPGPATLMSQLMRKELENQNRGGPLRRFFNHPWVVVSLLLVCVGILVWTFWPSDAEGLYQGGAALMASADPNDWDRAERDCFAKLDERFPDHPHKEEVKEFRQRIKDHEDLRQAEQLAERTGGAVVSEGQWFYREGLRLRQQGKEEEARRVWQGLVKAFKDVPAEKPWATLAEQELARGGPPAGLDRWEGVRRALAEARRLRDDNKRDAAEEIWKGLEELYRDDPSAKEIVETVRKDRGP